MQAKVPGNGAGRCRQKVRSFSNLYARDHLINFRICFIVRSFLRQLMLWCSVMILAPCTGETGFETRSG